MVVSARRLGAVKAGTAKVSDFKVPSIEPEPSATAARNLVNQFELPVLFYAACLSLYVTGGAGTVAIVAAWAFVLARAVHAYVHVTSKTGSGCAAGCSSQAWPSISCNGCFSPSTLPRRAPWRAGPGPGYMARGSLPAAIASR